jgi:cell division protein FtsW (lipid II flippase)
MGRMRWSKQLPWSIVALFAAIVFLGCLILARADDLYGSGGRYLNRQVAWSIIALIAMLAVSWPSYRPLARWSYGLLALAVTLLAAVYWFPAVNGAHRWIRLGPIGFQPSEFAKLAFVLGLARYLMHRQSYRELHGLLMPLVLVLVPVLLVLKEPDLGTSLVFLPVFYAMLFVAGARPRHLVIVAVVGLSITPLLWSQMSREQRSRVTALAEQTVPGETPTRDGYHLHQAKQLFALGGWWGSAIRGELTDDAGVYRLPEAHTDSIACVIAERFGVVGFSVTLALFVILVWRVLMVAEATREPFGRLVATGVAAMIAVQVTINAGMMLGLLPITGLTLPLVSYGGSSLIVNAIGLGLVLNVGLRPGYEIASDPFAFAER